MLIADGLMAVLVMVAWHHDQVAFLRTDRGGAQDDEDLSSRVKFFGKV